MEKQYTSELKGECAICKEPAFYTMLEIDPMAYLITCRTHRKHQFECLPEVIQKDLGLITEYPDHMKKCRACNNDLTPEEMDEIKSNHVATTCRKHILSAVFQQSGAARLYAFYLEYINEKKSMGKFMEWLQTLPVDTDLKALSFDAEKFFAKYKF